ncbi:39S ribosomal protein L50, mitochondrial-like [Biomphalaria glabrata]|uniref:Large ribosomal subunit protein mL50 n=1 Tax=Biomphalaria glabrata TaxID=6526 RepID=A0A9W2YII1_BIOGL|nr:39S ribosomal protein L50, mitochondrial-like [Biomphalaria glabrata]
MAASTKVLKLKTVVSHGKQCCSKIFIRNASWTTFFKKPKEEIEAMPRKIKPFDGPSTTSRLQSLKKKTVSCSVRGYNPPADVEAKILSIAATIIGFQVDMSYQLNDRLIKFKLLTKLMEEFDHIIPNTELCDLNTLANVVSYFDTPVRDTTSFDDLARQKLPKNLHIQLEPLRFDPETDTFFDGKTAFPNRPTIVSSLKYSKKYKGHSGESRNARSLTNFEEQKQLFEDAEKLNYTVKSS